MTELIAGEMTRRWGFRPRAAFRLAHGWSQNELAARLKVVARQHQLDGGTSADDIGANSVLAHRIGEYERWPFGGRRPSIYILTRLAATLGTSVDHLLDGDDHRALPETERVVLAALRRAAVVQGARPSGRRRAKEDPRYRDRPTARADARH